MTLEFKYREKFDEGKAEGRAEGALSMLLRLAKDGIITIPIAAEKAKMTEADFEKLLEGYTEE